jgi:hypothetical protein
LLRTRLGIIQVVWADKAPEEARGLTQRQSESCKRPRLPRAGCRPAAGRVPRSPEFEPVFFLIGSLFRSTCFKPVFIFEDLDLFSS